MGKPVIATAIGGPLDIIEDKVDGLLVPPQNASAVAEAIQWLTENPERAARIGQRARQKSLEKFSSSRLVENFMQVYRNLA